MANALAPQKTMGLGEGGLALAFTALAILSIVVAAKAYTPEYAFHAYLFTAGSIAAVFAIINRYYDRQAEPAPLTVDGKPNYNMGPVKFATVAAVFWGIAGFAVGLYIAEMAVVHPVAGAFGVYAEKYLNPWAGFSVRATYGVAQIIAIGAQRADAPR